MEGYRWREFDRGGEYIWRELDHGGGWVLYSYKRDRFVAIPEDHDMAPWTYYKNVTAAEAIEMFRNQFWRNV